MSSLVNQGFWMGELEVGRVDRPIVSTMKYRASNSKRRVAETTPV